MKQYDPESIRDFKKSRDFFKWIHNNGVMNLSEVIMYSIVDATINTFSLSFSLSIYFLDHAILIGMFYL